MQERANMLIFLKEPDERKQLKTLERKCLMGRELETGVCWG